MAQVQAPAQNEPRELPVLNDRQAVIAVMAANGRSNRHISIRLRIPEQAVEEYLRQALDILELASQENPTHPVNQHAS